MEQYGAVCLAIAGGVAAYRTTCIKEVAAVHWEHLRPEALYEFRVEAFGPVIVAMNAHGNSLYRDVQKAAAARLDAILSRFGNEQGRSR